MDNFRDELREILKNSNWSDNEKFEAIDELYEKYLSKVKKSFEDVSKSE